MEVRQAFADLAEVRGRLAGVQRFDGYSGSAAIGSGVVGIVAGLVQALVDPWPHGHAQRQTYLLIWLTCLGIALVLNYGAIFAWRSRNRGAQAAVQFRTVGMSIVPALAAGGVITLALVLRGLDELLPGMWCATYALGLFASRAMVPHQVVAVAVAFGAIATALLLFPAIDPLGWWIMPIAFGGGQIAIGAIVRNDGKPERIP
ncbi:MAG: hypothetical protein GIX03_02750 [Candidatus Eremiobacteraeota bacterium]|nr:hypothetical protein [Candidatus Eremiobacteraeota bacterium]MBC5801933.1 hypothetical protein [Candidatus Eremiobacteraeota bacterium]MBC5821658.1 hypothetical protein [Candidatus Eremiobacteraeota bacterium]